VQSIKIITSSFY